MAVAQVERSVLPSRRSEEDTVAADGEPAASKHGEALDYVFGRGPGERDGTTPSGCGPFHPKEPTASFINLDDELKASPLGASPQRELGVENERQSHDAEQGVAQFPFAVLLPLDEPRLGEDEIG